MKKWIVRILASGLLLLVLYWSLRREDPHRANEAEPVAGEPQGRRDGFFGELHATGTEPQADVQLILDAIETYTQLHRDQSRPIGLNEDLVQALTTRSPYSPALLEKDHPAIVEGELVDRWGTPLHLHAIAASHYTVRSAGPDRVLFTEDDFLAGEEALVD